MISYSGSGSDKKSSDRHGNKQYFQHVSKESAVLLGAVIIGAMMRCRYVE